MQVKSLLAVPLLASAAALAVTPARFAQNTSAPTPSDSRAPVIRMVQPPAPQLSSSAATGLSYWYSLRQSGRQPFTSYAAFLTRYPGWPGEAALAGAPKAR